MLDKEIRQKIAEYLLTEISLREFQQWFVPATWDIHQTGDMNLVRLTGKVELWLAEFSVDHLTEDELKYEMRQFLNEPTKITSQASVAETIHRRIVIGSSTITIQPFGKLNEVEYA